MSDRVEPGRGEVAGEDVVVGRAVVRVVVAERPHQRELVHLRRDLRQQVADLQAGDLRLRRVELAAELRGRVGLQVERVEVALPAVQEHEDERHVLLGLRLQLRLHTDAVGDAP